MRYNLSIVLGYIAAMLAVAALPSAIEGIVPRTTARR